MAKVKFIRDTQSKIEDLPVATDGYLYFATDTGSLFMGTGNGLVQITDNLSAFGEIILPNGDKINASELRDSVSIKTTGDKLTITKDSNNNILVNSTHNHDERYFTETEVNTKLLTVCAQIMELTDAVAEKNSGRIASAYCKMADAADNFIYKNGNIYCPSTKVTRSGNTLTFATTCSASGTNITLQ